MVKCRRTKVAAVLFCLQMLLCFGAAGCLHAAAMSSNAEPEIKKELLTDRKNDSIQIFYDRGDHKTAYQLINRDMSRALAEKDWESMISHYEMLIAIDAASNDYRSAFKHLREKSEIAQKYYTTQKDRIARDLQKQYDTEAVKRQIEKTTERLSKTEREIKTRSVVIFGLAGLAVLSITIVITQTFVYIRRRKLNSVVSAEIEQNEYQLTLLTDWANTCFEENRQLAEENTVLEKSNAVKDKLLSVISHDLRSPMSSLQALLSLFNTNNIARRDLVEFFGKLLSRVENTSTMLENLLHWSQYQLKGIEPIFETADIQKVIDDSINFYRMQAEQKHIVIDNSLKTSVKVYADVEMLKIILRNLISNALKFTHSGGIITIKALTKEGFVIVSVKDTGVGISPENQAKMFAMADFTTPGTEKEKGTGLGLMLCKDFVEHNHGKIWLDSKVDVGTTFYFSIPLATEE